MKTLLIDGTRSKRLTAAYWRIEADGLPINLTGEMFRYLTTLALVDPLPCQYTWLDRDIKRVHQYIYLLRQTLADYGFREVITNHGDGLYSLDVPQVTIDPQTPETFPDSRVPFFRCVHELEHKNRPDTQYMRCPA